MIDIKLDLNLKNVLERVEEIEIYRRYIGFTVEPYTMYKSPFRENDKFPSFNLFVHKSTGRLFYKDFGGDFGDCIQFVQRMHMDCDFITALDIINKDFNLNLEGTGSSVYGKFVPSGSDNKYKPRKQIQYKITRRPFEKYDKDYWGQYYIEEKVLKYYGVFPVQQVFMNNVPVFSWSNQKSNPLYGYWFGGNFWKFYKPLAIEKGNKWRSNIGSDTKFIQGWYRLPKKGKLCIITKSLKDVIVFRLLGLSAVAPHGERHIIDPNAISNLMERFEKILMFYDNDNEGMSGADKICSQYGFTYAFIPENEEKIKDISDYVKEYGLIEAMHLLNELYII